jgi:hypothetical protein
LKESLTPKYWPFGRSAVCTYGIYLNGDVPKTLVEMSHTPVQTRFGQAIAAALLVLSLAFLAGCQGVSAGNSGQQNGSLGFGSSALNFGNVAAGTSKTLTITATNSETQSVQINSAAVTSKYFTLVGPSLPVTVAAGQSATLSIMFTPNAAGSFNGTLSIASDASNSSISLAVSGTGTQAGELGLSGATGAFGGVALGGVASQTVTLTNNGAANVDISAATVSGTGFQISGISTPLTLTPAQSTTFNLSFQPVAAGSVVGTLTVVSDASNPTLTMPLSGLGVAAGSLGANPTYLAFGAVQVGSTETFSEIVTNATGSSATITQVGVSGAGFSLSGISAPLTLAAGQSANFTVSFAPASVGAVSGYVTITSTAPIPTLSISMDGQGAANGALTASPSSQSFGSVQVGTKQTLSQTLTNTGSSSVTLSQVGASGSGFSVSGISVPVTLTAGQSTTFNISFDPASAGNASGNVAITSDATNPTLNIPLSGTGAAAGALGSNPTSLDFGTVQLGNKQTLSETVTNNGGSSITISQATASGTGFSLSGISPPVTLTTGQSATFSVSFTPTTAGAASGNVTITSTASNPTLNIPLSGTGATAGALGSNPTSLDFGTVQLGNKQTLSETVTNNGGSSVTISQATASGTGFSLSGISAPVTLTAGQSATFSVSFTPTTAGAASGSVTITSNASNPTLTIPLSGTGTSAVGQLSVTPTTLAIGSVVVGTSGSGQGSLTATNANVTVTGAGSSTSTFSLSGLSLPVTIPAGRSVSFTVTFSPQTTGSASATLTFTSNAQPSTTAETVTGSGTAAPAYSVNLSWNASDSPNISGYNIYRAVFSGSCGSYSKINPSLNAATSYTDSVVADGTDYCYATTAVNSSNEESGYSNIVSDVQIPAP